MLERRQTFGNEVRKHRKSLAHSETKKPDTAMFPQFLNWAASTEHGKSLRKGEQRTLGKRLNEWADQFNKASKKSKGASLVIPKATLNSIRKMIGGRAKMSKKERKAVVNRLGIRPISKSKQPIR